MVESESESAGNIVLRGHGINAESLLQPRIRLEAMYTAGHTRIEEIALCKKSPDPFSPWALVLFCS
jgi:hypothetical protein